MQTTPSLLGTSPRSIAVLVLIALLASSAWAATDDRAAKPGDTAKKEDKPAVFTNKSLDQLAPPPPPTSLDHLTAPPPPAEAVPGGDGPLVITNEVLDRMVGPPEPAPPAAAPPDPATTVAPPKTEAAPLDPLAAMEKEKQDAAKRQQAAADAQKELAAAEAKVREVEQRLLAQRNPYLPRPPLSEAEQKKEEGLDGAARVQRTQEQLELARKEVERAREKLGQIDPPR